MAPLLPIILIKKSSYISNVFIVFAIFDLESNNIFVTTKCLLSSIEPKKNFLDRLKSLKCKIRDERREVELEMRAYTSKNYQTNVSLGWSD